MDDLIFSHDFPAQEFVQTLFERHFVLECKFQMLLDLLIDVLAQKSGMTRKEMLEYMNDMLENIRLDKIDNDPIFNEAWARWTEGMKKKFGLR